MSLHTLLWALHQHWKGKYSISSSHCQFGLLVANRNIHPPKICGYTTKASNPVIPCKRAEMSSSARNRIGPNQQQQKRGLSRLLASRRKRFQQQSILGAGLGTGLAGQQESPLQRLWGRLSAYFQLGSSDSRKRLIVYSILWGAGFVSIYAIWKFVKQRNSKRGIAPLACETVIKSPLTDTGGRLLVYHNNALTVNVQLYLGPQ